VGVSTALVSYVLNNKKQGRISQAVAEKIREAAHSMNYRVNQIARSLKSSKTYTLGLVLADIANPFSAALARVIEDEADRHQYTVIFGSSDENPDKYRKILDALLNRQVDGLILSPPMHAENQLHELQSMGVPFVMADRYFTGVDASYVVLDNFQAAFDATQHLIEQGFQRIAMINYAPHLLHLAERSQGYFDALKKNGRIAEPSLLAEIEVANLQEDVDEAVIKLLKQAPAIDAILFGSNVIALHAVKKIHQLGYKIPADLGLLCFDEADSFDLFYAPLSYIRQPIKTMGELAVARLVQQIDDPATPAEQVRLPGELVIRSSTRRDS